MDSLGDSPHPEEIITAHGIRRRYLQRITIYSLSLLRIYSSLNHEKLITCYFIYYGFEFFFMGLFQT